MIGAARAGAMSGLFSPHRLFANGEQGCWFDPSDLSTMFQDSAGTTPVTDINQSVGLILDKSTRGNHATQSTSGKRPILKRDISGRFYLEFLRTSTSCLITGNIDFTSSDKMTVFVGAHKATETGIIAELSSNYNYNNGAFFIGPGDWATGMGARWQYCQRGTATSGSSQSAQTPTYYAEPITSVLTGIGDIAADSSIIRINGAQIATANGEQGGGNFGTYPIYIGSRGNASLFFDGRIYGLIVRGGKSPSIHIAQTEAWINSKTGAF